jgi:putative oxidoreductase
MKKFIFATGNLSSMILIRLVVGGVFLSEGIQKFLYPETIGAGRFAKIGLPYPEFTAHFTGSFEIFCGILTIIGLATRVATIPLLCIISVALATTKWPILMNQGFWPMAHEARTDFAMFFCLIFLLINGAGALSIDKRIER